LINIDTSNKNEEDTINEILKKIEGKQDVYFYNR